MTPTRRGFITGLVSLIAAPAIVRYASIMPVRVMPAPQDLPQVIADLWMENYNENTFTAVLHPSQYKDLLRYAKNAIDAKPLIDPEGIEWNGVRIIKSQRA